MKKGDKIKDLLTGFEETIVAVGNTSVCITQTKRADKGINCTQWFDMTIKTEKERFKIIES